MSILQSLLDPRGSPRIHSCPHFVFFMYVPFGINFLENTEYYFIFMQTILKYMCPSEIKTWMSTDFLNESKNETIVFGPLDVSSSLNQVLGSLAAYVKTSVKNFLLSLTLPCYLSRKMQ